MGRAILPGHAKNPTFRRGGRVLLHPPAGPVLAVQEVKRELDRRQQQDQEFEDPFHPTSVLMRGGAGADTTARPRRR